MPRFAANLSTMYAEHPLEARFGAAGRDGFTAIEMQGLTRPAKDLTALARDAGLEWVLFNAPAGDMTAGERGIAALPGREEEFRSSMERALVEASVLNCSRVHVMSGLCSAEFTRPAMRDTLLANLAWAVRLATQASVTLLVEPINPRNVPGYFLNRQADAHAICAEIGSDALRVQMDFYHCQIVEGDLCTRWREFHQGVGHIQIAGVPDRHEPDLGEIAYPAILDLIDALGYSGWVGCEYQPRGGTSEGLGWLRAYEARALPRPLARPHRA